MLPNPVLLPQTAAATNLPFNATEADKVIFASTGTIAAAEVFTFWIANSSGGKTAVYNAAGAQVQITATLNSVMLEGGVLYLIDKSVTGAAAGLDASQKPRSGPQ